jgi:integrase
VNAENLCRACVLAVRFDDWRWCLAPSGGRDTQLALILPELRLVTRPAQTPNRASSPVWAAPLLAAARAANRVDDPRICPPAMPGQLALFPPLRRRLTFEHAQRIRDRHLPDEERAEPFIKQYGSQHSEGSCERVRHAIRLALAVRDADAQPLIEPWRLADLPGFRSATAAILERAGLLAGGRPLHYRTPAAPRPPGPRSCDQCHSWGFESRCNGCRGWSRLHPQRDRCTRCQHEKMFLYKGMCRACHVHIAGHGPPSRNQRWVQLWLGEQLAARLMTPAGTLGYRASDKNPGKTLARRLTRPPVSQVSAHLLNPDQFVLLDMRRDWRRVVDSPLPALTPAAQALVDEFEHCARSQGWLHATRRDSVRTLLLVLAWLGAQAPIHEADVRSVGAHLTHARAWRVVQFLRSHALLIPIPRPDADQQMVEQTVDALPDHLAVEVSRWVQVLRGQGRRQHAAMSWATIRSYLARIQPVLGRWSARSSLREITRADVEAVMRDLQGHQARGTAGALRSLFRALKQERLIFTDPTRGVSVTDVAALPAQLPSDRLAGLLGRTTNPAVRLIIALSAIHALTRHDVRHLRLDDLDLTRGRLTVRRNGLTHMVYLDPTTYQLARQWLHERRRRWPRTTNPHLLVTARTAPDNRHPPIDVMAISRPLQQLGHGARQLRADRILNEARHSADPISLIRIFGISVTTAMRYLRAAHPERCSVPPR